MFLNPRRYEFLFPLAAELTVASAEIPAALAAILKAVLGRKAPPTPLADFVKSQQPDVEHQKIAEQLGKGERKAILLGHLALQHPQFADIRALAAALAEITGAKLGYISEGANSAGAWLAGAVPHRLPGGKKAPLKGLDTHGMFAEARRAYLLLGVEPELDCGDSASAMEALKQANAVIAVTPFVTDIMKTYASVLLPAATFGETSGTYVNVEGRWQNFTGMVKPLGEARPAWKILRVLGNQCELPGFDYQSSEEVREELRNAVGELQPDNSFKGTRILSAVPASAGLRRVAELPLYASDMLVRRAASLQETRDADAAYVRLAPADAKKFGLADGARAIVKHNGARVSLSVIVDASVAAGEVWLPAGLPETAGFGALHASVEVERAA